MGTPEFAVGALEKIIEAGHEVVLCVTQPDKPKGRGKELAFSPVKECAVKHGIPVFQPEKIKLPESVEELRKYPADVAVVAAFGQIISKEILDMTKYGCINIHASLLPLYRGAAPIQWAILNGEKVAGITIMQLDEGLDTGDILLREAIPLAEDETGDSLHDKLSVLGANLIVEALDKLEKGEIRPIPQPDGPLFYAKMLTKDMGKIDYSKDAAQIERWIRGLYSWPGAYTFYGDKMIKIISARIVENASKGNPGEVTEVTKNEIVIQCGRGSIALLRVIPQGKKEMSVHDFLLGNRVAKGDIFS